MNVVLILNHSITFNKVVDPISDMYPKGVQLFCVYVVIFSYRFETMGNGSGSLLDIVSLKV
jgi:hypothetical protein